MVKLQKAKDTPLAKIKKWPLWAETKFDGIRLAIIVTENPYTCTIQTFNGKEVVSLDIVEGFKFANPGIYDGELIAGDGSTKTRTKISGEVNSAIHGGMLSMINNKLVLFDYIKPGEFESSVGLYSYEARRDFLLREKQLLPEFVTVADAKPVHSVEEAQAAFEELTSVGMEGLILKKPKHKYSFKRSADWIKMKETKTMDLICTNVKEGTGKYAGMVGALHCIDNVNKPTISVWVGSGLTDADRAKDTLDYTGQTIEVKYNTVIENALKPGMKSLFLPRFSCVRFDK